MSTPVVMPQMGESIAEGTIVRWIKKVGDSVDRDEPLFEISTDKVDAEIPSPTAGVLLEITVKEGETVPIHSVVATIGSAGSLPVTSVATTSASTPMPEAAVGQPDAPRAATSPAAAPAASPIAVNHESAGDGRAQRSSPLVRRIAKEHGVDIGHLTGSGAGGRVTKHDILEFIESASAAPRLRRARLSAGSAAGAASSAAATDFAVPRRVRRGWPAIASSRCR